MPPSTEAFTSPRILPKFLFGDCVENFEALHDGQAGVDHRAELAREDDDFFFRNSAAPRQLELDVFTFFFAFRKRQPLRAQAIGEIRLAIGFHDALADVTGSCARFECELRHLVLPRP